MSYRRRYSPSYTSSSSTTTGLMRGPSSIYTSTSSVLGGGNYLRDSVGSLRTSSSVSPRRFNKSTLGIATSSATSRLGTTTTTLPTSYQTRARSARVSSFLNDTDSFSRTRSRSPTFSSTPSTTTITTSWRPRTTTDYTKLTFPTSNYRSRHRSADLDGSYSIDQDPIVAAISDRLSRESSSSEHRYSLPTDYRTYSSLSAFDNDTASDSCIGYDRPFSSLSSKNFDKTLDKSFIKSDYFNKEEQQFLSSLNQLVNNAKYPSNDKLISSSYSDRLWNHDTKFSRSRLDDLLNNDFGLGGGSLVRSNSFHELRDLELSASLGSGMTAARDRHKTLAYGVSAADLGLVVHPSASSSAVAAINFLKTNPMPDFNFRTRPSPDYEQAGNVGIRGPASSAPLSGFKSEMSIALAHPSESVAQRTGNLDHESSSSRSVSGDKPTEKSQNGEIDYKKLWEETQLENIKLRDDLNKVRDDLKSTKKKLDVANSAPPPGSSLTEAEKKEKLALEKKLSEMEEELKQFQKLKAENERLKSESRALARVVSRLSAAADYRTTSNK